MGVTEAFECDICGNLYRKAFTVIVEAEGVKFSYKGDINQPKLVLVVCGKCLDRVGEVIAGALH